MFGDINSVSGGSMVVEWVKRYYKEILLAIFVILTIIFIVLYDAEKDKQKPSFGNIVYTGPAATLTQDYGTCLSDRNRCGLEEFSGKFKSRFANSQYGSVLKEKFSNDSQLLRSMTEKSRFIGENVLNPIIVTDESTDMLQKEIKIITGDDDNNLISAVATQAPDVKASVIPPASQSASTFAASAHNDSYLVDKLHGN